MTAHRHKRRHCRDAPEFVLELLVEEHDGWLDHDSVDQQVRDLPPLRLPPLALPDAPRRVKRPDLLDP